MGANYTRQSTYTDGDTISAADTNDEFDQLLAAFAANTGHTHDGTTGEGGPITSLFTNAVTFGTGADTDISVTFDANSNDGVITWMEDEDYFQFSDEILMTTTEKILFRDTALSISSSTDGQLDIDADTEVEITAPLVEMSADATVGDDFTLKSDAAVLGFGADTDVTLTHVADTALLLNSSRQLQFGDSGTYIHQSADGVLDLVSDTEIEINATTIDMNGAAELSGNLTLGAQLRMPDNTANKILVADGTSFEEKAVGDLSSLSSVASGDLLLIVDVDDSNNLKKITRSDLVTGLASGTMTDVVDDTSPQLGGNLDMNGNDIVTTSNATIDLAPNGTGTVVVRGNTNSGRIVFNCESNSHGQTLASQPHSASVTNTMLLPAGADSTLVSLVSTDTLQNKTLTSPVLNTATVGTSIVPASADGATLGSASAEFSDLFLADGGTIQLGNDQDVRIIHDADDGLILKSTATGDDNPFLLTLQTGETDIAADDVLGQIDFQAPDEGTGTDAILVAAGIAAVSEGDFSSSSNATKLSFRTAASETASEKMALSSVGNLTVAGTIVPTGAITANAGVVVDNITIDGTEIDLSSGDLTVDVAGDIILDAGGNDFKFQASGTEVLRITNNSSDVEIKPTVDAKDIIFKQFDGTAVMTIEDNVSVAVNNDVTVAGRASGHVTTDNDGSFDLAVGNDFQCTPSGNFTLTFTNAAAGQSGNILLINSGGHTVSAHADVAINATTLTALTTAGTYHLAYFCSAASGNNTIAVSASGALT